MHAGQAVEGVAQGRFALLEQQFVFQQVVGRRGQIGVAAQGQGGHFHRVEAVFVGVSGLGKRHGPAHGGQGGGPHGENYAFHGLSWIQARPGRYAWTVRVNNIKGS